MLKLVTVATAGLLFAGAAVAALIASCSPSTELLAGRPTVPAGSKEERWLDGQYAGYNSNIWTCADGRRIRYRPNSSITCAPDRP